MFRLIFFLIVAFGISFSQAEAQTIVKEHKFSYKYNDHLSCDFHDLDITYPFFYYKNGIPLTGVNDSIQKILEEGIVYLFENSNNDFRISDVISKDTSIVIGDTATVLDCDPMSLIPRAGSVSYTIFINEDQLLSFVMRLSYHAGSGGHDALDDVAPFCFDLKTNTWVDLNTLFPDDFDTLLLKRTDSLFSVIILNEFITGNDHFANSLSIEKGNLTFYSIDHWGGNYFYREVVIPYEEFGEHLAPRYLKILKPSPRKVKKQKVKNPALQD